MYVGTSLGKCIRSLTVGEVSVDDVLFIVTQTRGETFEKYMEVVDAYVSDSYYFARDGYPDFSDDPEKIALAKQIASKLYQSGKIHQPRNFFNGYSHGILPTWLELVPTIESTNPAVVDAYDKYRALLSLVK